MVKLSLQNPSLQVRRDAFELDKTYNELSNLMRDIKKQFQTIADVINYLYAGIELTNYTVATVPTASDWERRIIYISDESGGAVPAFSDGTNWRRITDRNIIS